MKRNASKYRAILMGKSKVIPQFYCNSTIPITGDLEMVGVCIGDKIQFERHIANVCRKVSQHIAVLKLIKKILPFETRKCLYLGFIILHFNYCSETNKNITARLKKSNHGGSRHKNYGTQWALSIRPEIPEIPGWGAKGTVIFQISFPNFGCTSRGWPKIPEKRNNREILFHSTIPVQA